MKTLWTPTRHPTKRHAFLRTPEAAAFFKGLRGVCPGWKGTWSLVPHKFGLVSHVRTGPAALLALDLLCDFGPTKEGLLISPGDFDGPRRQRVTWQRSHLLPLDFDDGSDPAAVISAFPGLGLLLHGSFNDWRPKDGRSHGRWRGYMFLARPVADCVDYALLWAHIDTLCRAHGATPDPSPKNVNCLMYTIRDGSGRPPTKPGHPCHWIAAVPGRALDPEALPHEVVDGETVALTVLRQRAEEAAQKARDAVRTAYQTGPPASQPSLARAAEGRLRSLVEHLISHRAPGEGRNTGVYACGARLGCYVASGLIADAESFKEIIRDAAESAGLAFDVERQLDNGFQHGLRKPLDLEGVSHG
jgi:hypothetical protein